MKRPENNRLFQDKLLSKLAATFCVPALLDIICQLKEYLLSQPLEYIRGLAWKLCRLLEYSLMDAVISYLSTASESSDYQVLQNDWNCFVYPSEPYLDYHRTTAELELYISCINTVEEYCKRRTLFLAMIQTLSPPDQTRACGCLLRKAAELLIQALIPNMLKQQDNPLLRHQFSLWNDLKDCLIAGGEEFSLFFLHHDGTRIRVLAPWNQNADISVQNLYQMAHDISEIAVRGHCWDHDALVSCFWHLLDLKVRCLLDHGMSDTRDGHGILELYAMVGWTERQEFHPFWKLSRFQALLQTYVPQTGESHQEESYAF